MHTLKKYLIGFGVVAIFFIIILLRAAVWNDFIQDKINGVLESSGWSISAEKSSGHLLGTTYLENLTLTPSSGIPIRIEKASFNLGIISSIIGPITFDLLTIESFNAPILDEWFKSDSLVSKYEPLFVPFNVKSFFISGELLAQVSSQPYGLRIKIGGEIIGGSNPSFHCDLMNVTAKFNPSINLNFSGLKFEYRDSKFFLNDLLGELSGLPIEGEGIYDQITSQLSGNIRIDEFNIPDELFSQLPLQSKFSSFAVTFDFESEINSFKGNLSLENDLELAMKGQFDLKREKKAWVLKNLELEGENSQLTMNGVWVDEERVSSYLNLENLDLSKWLNDQNTTKLSGLLLMEGGLKEGALLDQIDLSLDVVESVFFEQGEISVHGQISYHDSLLSTMGPVVVMAGESIMTLEGGYDYKSEELAIMTDLENADIDLVNQFLPGEFTSGQATGRLSVRGHPDAPSVDAELTCNNIKYGPFTLTSIQFNSQSSVRNDSTLGFVNLKLGKGFWKNHSFESGTVNATFENKKVQLENCYLKSNKDYLQFSGHYDGNNEYELDRLQLAYQDHFLVTSRPISFFYKDLILKVEPFEVHINDGIIEGVITGGINSEGQFKMSNFDADIITNIFSDPRLQVSGLVFGEVNIGFGATGLIMDMDLSMKAGSYMGEPFDQMTLVFLYKNDILYIDDISMTRGKYMGIETNGVIILDKNKKVENPILLQTTFDNLSLEFIHKFIPEFFAIGGEASGNINIEGFPGQTQFSFNVDIKDGLFDRVKLGSVRGQGKYDGKKFFLESAETNNDQEKITARGSLPFDLNISSERFGQFFPKDSLDFHVEAHLRSLPFLSPYIENLDSVRGDIDVTLSLTGPVESIQRSGHMAVKNGKVYTLLLGDPITKVEGDAYMNHNQMIIQSMKSLAYHPNGKYPKLKTQNTIISGSMDFTDFFKPRYDLTVKGKEASFQTLFLDIEAQSNLDLSIVGKDSVTISGIIEVLDGAVFYEFTTEEVGETLEDETGTVMAYQLSVPIKGTALFQNSQVDAIVTGELSLSQIGNQEMDFGGEIFVEDGSVFSYKDNFKGLNGYVRFDDLGFNPFFDVNAETFIDDEQIDLRISGNMENLDINLQSASGFSESDILELLTWGRRFEDQKLTSMGFGNQTVSILGSILEKRLEKNLRDTELGKMNLVDNIDISGSAGLLQGSNEDFEITAKKQIGDKTYLNLSYKRSFSLTNPNQSQIGVEYKLSRHFSVVGNIDESGNLNLKYRYRYAY